MEIYFSEELLGLLYLSLRNFIINCTNDLIREKKMSQEFEDWFSKGLLKFGDTPYGTGVFAKTDIPMNSSHGNCIGLLEGDLVTKHFANTAGRFNIRYLIHIGSTDSYVDLSKSWVGRINHHPSTSNLCNLVPEEEYIYQTRSIKKGQELFFDYSCDYWTYQVSAIEFDSWIKMYPSSKNIWKKMHATVIDYTDLLQLPIDNLTPKDLLLLVQSLI